MESGQAVAEDAAADGVKLMKKPGGLSVARGTPPAEDDDGGGGGRPAASRADAGKNWNSVCHSASTTAGTSASNRAVASNGRGSSSSNSLLLRRRRLKRNLSSTTTSTSNKMNPALSSSASLHTRSLDRKTLLKHRQNMQLQPADRDWVRADLHRGSVHVHDRLTPSYPRPVLCTMDTTAGEMALKLCSKSSSVMRIFCNPKTDQNGNVKYEYSDNNNKVSEDSGHHHHLGPLEPAEMRGPAPRDRLRLLLMEDADDRQKQQDADGKLFTPESESQDHIITCSLSDLNTNSNLDNDGLNSGSDVESSAFDDLSSGARLSEHRDSLSDDMVLGTEASILSPDMYGSSSDELELDCPASTPGLDPHHSNGVEHLNNMESSRLNSHSVGSLPPSSSSAGSLSTACSTGNTPDGPEPEILSDVKSDLNGDCDSSPTLYVQLHGEAVRRLSPDERPLQIQNDFLFKLGFKDPWRVQEEGLNTEIGSLLRFYAGQ